MNKENIEKNLKTTKLEKNTSKHLTYISKLYFLLIMIDKFISLILDFIKWYFEAHKKNVVPLPIYSGRTTVIKTNFLYCVSNYGNIVIIQKLYFKKYIKFVGAVAPKLHQIDSSLVWTFKLSFSNFNQNLHFICS